jgi:hypothetical protein
VPIIAVTAGVLDTQEEELLEAGYDAVVPSRSVPRRPLRCCAPTSTGLDIMVEEEGDACRRVSRS